MSPPDLAPFRFIGERERFSNSFIRLVSATFVDPDGFTFERDLVRHQGAVCVVPLEEDGHHVVMVRQYRAAIDRYVLEIPAGKCDVAGEPPERTAARELQEEVGLEASSVVELGRFFNSPGFTDEETICYLAEGLSPSERECQGIEEEHMTVETIVMDELYDLVAKGELVDAKTIISLALVLQVRSPAKS